MTLSSTGRLLRDLVRTPSVSGNEGEAARRLADWARGQGLAVRLDGSAVRIEVDSGKPGPTLLLASHLDTVPAGEGWDRDPLAGDVEDGVLWGRGASDAKASVAAMAAAAVQTRARRGRLVVLATYGEETAATTMPAALSRLGRVDHAIVGEPTSLDPAVAQRGLLVLRLTWSGRACHAGWAATLPDPPENPIVVAAEDLTALGALRWDPAHPELGRVSVTPTVLRAGEAHNAIPSRCDAVLDVRTIPGHANDDILAAIRRVVRGSVEPTSQRFLPCETPAGSRLLAAVRRARPASRPFASPTASDWVFLRHVDAVKLGPGDSRLSHTAEERVPLDAVDEAERLYAAVATEILS